MNDSFKKSGGKDIFNLKVIKKGIVVFAIISLISMVSIFIYKDGLQNIDAWKKVSLTYLSFGFITILIDLYIGGLRNHIFVKEFVPGISQMVSIKANLANIFMGAITPGQSGGGPAQWYYYTRNGVSLVNVVGVSVYNWISTLIFFPISGALALLILKEKINEGFIVYLTEFAFSIFTSFFVLVMVGFFAPSVIEFIIKGLAKTISFVNRKWSERLTEKGNQAITKLAEYRHLYIYLIKRKPQLMLYSFLLTVLLYFNKYLLAYVFVLAFGIEGDFINILAVMAVAYLLLYFAPSPGGSGIAELGMTALLVPVVGLEIAPSITLLHRSFLVFIPAIIGSFVVIKQLSTEVK